MIVSQADVPLYELELVAPAKARRWAAHGSASAASLTPCLPRAQKDDSTHLHQFILHAALDMVEERVWDTSSLYLKASARPRRVRAASRAARGLQR